MHVVPTVIFYIVTFLAVYVQVFFLVTFFEKRNKIVYRPDIKLKNYPRVTITVPCFNEEKTIFRTVKSLLELDYPKDKIEIFLIDDGSTDSTWKVIKRFDKYSNIRALKKENGGKYTALNWGLDHSTGEFFGCLDADSFVHPLALKRILKYFENSKETMAVAPSVTVHQPKSIIQKAQTIEYHMSVYNKKMLAFMGAINVTPGPFSIFRKRVFDELGPYRKAHNTEDQEIALRMQKHGYKIDHCPDAYVYTQSPKTVMKLYRQRIRWVYGFIKNFMDYRDILFKKKYGNIAFFTLPAGIISIGGIVFLLANFLWGMVAILAEQIVKIQTVGFSSGIQFNFEWFYVDTKAIFFLLVILYVLVITSTMIGRKIAERKTSLSPSIIYFFFVYSFIAPFWIVKALFNAVRSKETSWIAERKI